MSRSIINNKNVIGILSVILCILIIEVLIRAEIINSVFIPPPSEIIKGTYVLLKEGKIFSHISITMQRIIFGFLISVLLGISTAVLCSMSKLIENALYPLIEFIRSIAPLALLPAFMLIFGIGMISKIAIIVWVTWIPIFLNTLHGMKSVDEILIKAAKSMGSTKLDIALKVIIPAAFPFILAGLRLGMGSAFLVLVAAEMMGANTGLGFYILETSQTFKITEMYSGILLIGIIGLAINWVFLKASKLFAYWNKVTE